VGAGFTPTSERRQTELLARSYLGALISGAAPNISWYDFRNDGDDPFDFEANMGVVTRAFEPKPAYRAYATITGLLAGRRDGGSVDLGPDLVAHRFADDQRAVLVVWSGKEPRRVALPAPAGTTCVSLMGETGAPTTEPGTLELTVLPGVPRFVCTPVGRP
jgi:hypothetical protein